MQEEQEKRSFNGGAIVEEEFEKNRIKCSLDAIPPHTCKLSCNLKTLHRLTIGITKYIIIEGQNVISEVSNAGVN